MGVDSVVQKPLMFSFEELRFILREVGRGHGRGELVDMFEMRKTCDEMKRLIRNGSERIGRRTRRIHNEAIGKSQSGSQGG